MKKHFINLKLLSVPLAFVVAQSVSHAMPGMHGKINSSGGNNWMLGWMI